MRRAIEERKDYMLSTPEGSVKYIASDEHMGVLHIFKGKISITIRRDLTEPLSVFMFSAVVMTAVQQICMIATQTGCGEEALSYTCSAVAAPLPFDVCPSLAQITTEKNGDEPPLKRTRSAAKRTTVANKPA
jgi:hypothetical protein